MSERRTAEIKFRCTPTFKSGLQSAADAAGQTVTEYVESAVWAQQNAKLDGTRLVVPVADGVSGLKQIVRPGFSFGAQQAAVAKDGAGETPDDPTDFYGGPDFDAAGVADIAVPVLNEKPQIAEALEAQAATAPTCNCRAWEFCTHKAKA